MSSTDTLMAAAGSSVAPTYVDDVFSAYTYTPAATSTETRTTGIALASIPAGQAVFITPGTSTWVCPAGVTSVCVVGIGASGLVQYDLAGAIFGGGGGGLGWRNNVAVTPGTSYTVVVPAYGGTVAASFNGTDYGSSASYGTGGTYSGTGGGNGGNAGYAGGGAGGYSGAGGSPSATPAGAGGAGGAGGVFATVLSPTDTYLEIGNGGNTGLYGQGTSGAAGSNAAGFPDNRGGTGSALGPYAVGGGGTVYLVHQNPNTGALSGANVWTGGDGGVRIIWGYGRAFPSTNTGDVATVAYDSTVGGMVWTKRRDGVLDHFLSDTVRGAVNLLSPNATSASSVGTRIESFTPTGFTGTDNAGGSFVSWTFKKAPKFFDVVTFTGIGTFNHSLGSVPGMIIFKRTDGLENWQVYHKDTSNGVLYLNTTGAYSAVGSITTATSTTFTSTAFASAGWNYVAYLFAHDTSANGLIQCGSFTTDASGNATVSLGWEPQYLLYKTSSTTGNWQISDTARGFTVGNTSINLNPNTTAAEAAAYMFGPTATGFGNTATGQFAASTTYIYMAIRRPNKPPTLGTQVYKAIDRTGTSAVATVTGVGFAPDALLCCIRSAAGGNVLATMLVGSGRSLFTPSTAAEQADAAGITAFGPDGVSFGADGTWTRFNWSYSYVNHFFKRAPGVFDVVCYTGTGSAIPTIPHGLGVVPELMIVKRRALNDWVVYAAPLGNTQYLYLESTNGQQTGAFWNNTTPTTTSFSVGGGSLSNTDGYVVYLFATKAGISKVGSYTGDGTTGQTVNCGFTTGARFILIKRTNTTGDWYVWNSVRGIVAGNDPHLSLNTALTEVATDDSIDPDTSGFIVNQIAATDVNVTSATYIYLAFA